MKKSKLTLLCVLLVIAITCASVFLASCNDESKKQDAVITADEVQEFLYDGKVHNVQATLNHDEAALSYSPSQGFAQVGEYEIKISSPSTKHYKAAEKTVTLKIINDSTLNRWQYFLKDLTSAYAIGDGDVKFNVKASATIHPKEGQSNKLTLDAVGNLDLTNTTKNNTDAHILLGVDDEKFGVYFQNGVTYLKINDELFSLNNLDLVSLLGKDKVATVADENQGGSIADSIIAALPLVLFNNQSEITLNDGVWNLSFNVPSIWGKIKSIVLPLISKDLINEENTKLLDNFFKTNQVIFKLKLDLNTQNSAKAEAEVNVSTYGTIKADITALEISNGAYEAVEGSLTQAQLASAKSVNIANVEINGTLNLVNKLGETYEHLSWKLVADIDPIALADAIKEASTSSDKMSWLNNEQVRKMKLYFSLYHVHQSADGATCSDAMCPTRAGGMEDTTLLDIAFDPQNFGDSKLYLAANLSRIFSAKSLDAMLKNINGMISSMAGSHLKGLLDANFFTAIDLTKTIVDSEDTQPEEPDGEDDAIDIKALINPIISLLSNGIKLQDSAITLDMEQTYSLIDSLLDLNSLVNINLENMIKINASNIKDGVFKGLLSPDEQGESDKAFNALSFGVTSVKFGNAETFNCKEAITHDPINTSKARKFGDSKPLSLDNANAKTNGRVFNTKQTYDDYTAEKGIHVTEEELNADVVGKLIEYTYTAMDGQTYTATTQIIAYEGLDKTKLNTPQTIKAIVLPLDGKGGIFSDILWSVLKSLGSAGLIGGFLPSNITIPFRADVIDMQITLTEVKSAQFTMDTPLEDEYLLAPYEYDKTAKLNMSKHLSGTIDLEYTDGFTRTISASASSDLLDDKFLINDGKEYTITLSHYSMPDIKKDYKVSATAPSVPTPIINDDGGLSVLYYGPTQGFKLQAVLKSSGGVQTLDTSLYTVKINGVPVDNINVDSDNAGNVTIFANKDAITIDHDRRLPKYSMQYLYFSLVKDSESTEEAKSKNYFSKSTIGQEVTTANKSNITNLGSQIDGMITYNYWLDSDDAEAKARTLTLKFDESDNKYYMVNDDASVKAETAVKAYDYYDKESNTNLLVDGVIPRETLKRLAYDADKKATKSFSVKIDFTFTVDGKEVNYQKTSQSISVTKLASGYTSNVTAGETFKKDWLKFTVVSEDWKLHEYKLAFKDGKYVLEDSSTENKLDDIQITVIAVDGDKNPIELTNGVISPDLKGGKVTLTAQFTYDGLEYEYAFASNKNIV